MATLLATSAINGVTVDLRRISERRFAVSSSDGQGGFYETQFDAEYGYYAILYSLVMKIIAAPKTPDYLAAATAAYDAYEAELDERYRDDPNA